jgi:hypothetical protein
MKDLPTRLLGLFVIGDDDGLGSFVYFITMRQVLMSAEPYKM